MHKYIFLSLFAAPAALMCSCQEKAEPKLTGGESYLVKNFLYLYQENDNDDTIAKIYARECKKRAKWIKKQKPKTLADFASDKSAYSYKDRQAAMLSDQVLVASHVLFLYYCGEGYSEEAALKCVIFDLECAEHTIKLFSYENNRSKAARLEERIDDEKLQYIISRLQNIFD